MGRGGRKEERRKRREGGGEMRKDGGEKGRRRAGGGGRGGGGGEEEEGRNGEGRKRRLKLNCTLLYFNTALTWVARTHLMDTSIPVIFVASSMHIWTNLWTS